MSDYLDKLIAYEESVADTINTQHPNYEGSDNQDCFRMHQSNICSLLAIKNQISSIKELEQQLSNSTPNAAIRELIDSYEDRVYKAKFRDDRDYAAEVLIGSLNKLLEGDSDERKN